MDRRRLWRCSRQRRGAPPSGPYGRRVAPAGAAVDCRRRRACAGGADVARSPDRRPDARIGRRTVVGTLRADRPGGLADAAVRVATHDRRGGRRNDRRSGGAPLLRRKLGACRHLRWCARASRGELGGERPAGGWRLPLAQGGPGCPPPAGRGGDRSRGSGPWRRGRAPAHYHPMADHVCARTRGGRRVGRSRRAADARSARPDCPRRRGRRRRSCHGGVHLARSDTADPRAGGPPVATGRTGSEPAVCDSAPSAESGRCFRPSCDAPSGAPLRW